MCKCNSTLIDPGYSQNYGCGCQGIDPGFSYGGCGCGRQEIVPAYTPDVSQGVNSGYSCGCGPTYGCGCGSYDPCCYVVPAALRLPSGFVTL
ncbi:MAG: hypothetical protein LBT88_03675 [Oscillospiraceae bacterium]|jgi:hypothetical protein|nr:hypothetical protein [Oscillospiraceae bacterium]